MKVIDRFECCGTEYTTFKCSDCGWQTTTFAGGEPSECMGCLENECKED